MKVIAITGNNKTTGRGTGVSVAAQTLAEYAAQNNLIDKEVWFVGTAFGVLSVKLLPPPQEVK